MTRWSGHPNPSPNLSPDPDPNPNLSSYPYPYPIPNPNPSQVEWANEPLAGAPHGTLSVRVSWAAAPKTGRHALTLTLTLTLSLSLTLTLTRHALASTPRLEQHGTLSVHVIEALNLVAADEHDPPSSDPYVKLKLSGLPKGNILQQAHPQP